jgi:acetolactate synthase-1/2/3 large subunit
MPAIKEAMAEPGAFLIDFRVEPEENVYPMVQLGGSLVDLLEDGAREEATWPQTSTR